MTEFAGIFYLIQTFGGHPIADGDIALTPEGMVGEMVGLEIGSHIAIAPLQNGQKLPAGILPAENLLFLAMVRTGTTEAGQPEFGMQLPPGAAQRLDADDFVEFLQSFRPLLPESPVAGLDFLGRNSRAIDL